MCNETYDKILFHIVFSTEVRLLQSPLEHLLAVDKQLHMTSQACG